MAAINFDKLKKNVEGNVQEIPVNTNKPNEVTPTEIMPPKKQAQEVGRPAKNRPIARTISAGIEKDVWQAMKYRKLMLDESYVDQINKALRLYLEIKK